MKKFCSFALALLLVFICASAFSADMYIRFSTYGSTDNVSSMFDGDTFALDLYFTNDLKAYIQQTVWKGNDATTSVKYASIKSKVGDSQTLYFVFADGSYYTGHYDEKDYMFWLDLPGGSIRLKMVDEMYSSDFVVK